MRDGDVCDGQGRVLAAAYRTENAWERARGLLGRPPLGPSRGLWIAPCGSVHTFGMGYPLDVVFLNRAGTVLKIAAAVRPLRMAYASGASTALEFAAGQAAALGLRTGMQLTWHARN
ncbi:MAG: DUF192 domain-containing protein [Betaproteobacteria bacterium]|nr:DUF192 domain-containing protein [Betaproteobacteria bacterium]